MNSIPVILPVASLSAIYLARMVELGTKRDTIRGPVRERLTLRLFMLAGTLMVFGSLIEFFARHLKLNWWTFAAGWLCAVSSVVIRRRAIAALGKFWSLHVEIRENHQFVQSGPFRWVRHPTYFSMILELLGFGLIMNAAYTTALVAIIFVPTLIFRIRTEETALVAKLGDAYKNYQTNTPALFPYKLPQAK
ncbi:MAG TPA: isoprenylcysteine carboxylmethyltransferase family protein [Candidatus Binatia bacterium]|nr:isoprenylcysteine carboxylmethyltransferase family protein [Candidatus Binatia bacterium]